MRQTLRPEFNVKDEPRPFEFDERTLRPPGRIVRGRAGLGAPRLRADGRPDRSNLQHIDLKHLTQKEGFIGAASCSARTTVEGHTLSLRFGHQPRIFPSVSRMQKIRAAQGAHPSGQFQRRYLHYPPAHAPLSGRAFVRAFRTLLRGPNAARTALADALRQTFDADHAFLFGSGTQALSAALSFVRQRMGEARPIALPAFTCWDVASAAAAANTEIVFYDVDPITLGPDWASLERALAGGAGAVVIASLYGVPVDWAAVEQLCSRYDAIPVEDAAQGSTLR